MAKTKKTVKAVKQAEVTQNIEKGKETGRFILDLNPAAVKNPAERQIVEEFISLIKKAYPEVPVENDHVFSITVDELDKLVKAIETKSKKAPKPPAKLLKNKKKS